MQLFDTHCHIHEATFQLEGDDETRARWLRAGKPDPDDMIARAAKDGVTRLLCVGTTVPDSRLAVDFARERDAVWSSVGIHPHAARRYVDDARALQRFRDLATRPKVVAVGEIGLDYFYENSPKEAQKQLLRWQLDVAVEHDLPLIFHVREAFEDFWQIFDQYKGLRGVVHSFTAGQKELDQILARDLYVGLNGIVTFTKDTQQLEAVRRVPIARILIETDAPFLTPIPFRGKICEPRHVKVTAEFLANLRGESLEELAAATTHNALELFTI